MAKIDDVTKRELAFRKHIMDVTSGIAIGEQHGLQCGNYHTYFGRKSWIFRIVSFFTSCILNTRQWRMNKPL